MLELSADGGGLPPDPGALWAATEREWRRAVPDCSDLAAPRDARHAYAVLRGLTSSSGGMVAAATTSLPERANSGRTYDYRYAWLRDQCYAGLAVAAHGPHELLDSAVRFVSERLLGDGDGVRPAYTVTGEPMPGSGGCRCPAIREAATASATRRGPSSSSTCSGGAPVVRRRGPPRPPGHRGAGGGADRGGRRGAPLARTRRRPVGAGEPVVDALPAQRGLRAARHRGRLARTGRPPLRRPRRARSSPRPAGAACTRTGSGAGPPTTTGRRPPSSRPWPAPARRPGDPVAARTRDRVERHLAQDGYLYRFAHGGAPLGEAEGAFLLCSLHMALATLRCGDRAGAFRWF